MKIYKIYKDILSWDIRYYKVGMRFVFFEVSIFSSSDTKMYQFTHTTGTKKLKYNKMVSDRDKCNPKRRLQNCWKFAYRNVWWKNNGEHYE